MRAGFGRQLQSIRSTHPEDGMPVQVAMGTQRLDMDKTARERFPETKPRSVRELEGRRICVVAVARYFNVVVKESSKEMLAVMVSVDAGYEVSMGYQGGRLGGEARAQSCIGQSEPGRR